MTCTWRCFSSSAAAAALAAEPSTSVARAESVTEDCVRRRAKASTVLVNSVFDALMAATRVQPKRSQSAIHAGGNTESVGAVRRKSGYEDTSESALDVHA